MHTTTELTRPIVGTPLRGLWGLIREMNRIADTTTYDALVARPNGAEVWGPATEVFTRGTDLVIRCELAGVQWEDFEVTYTGGDLVITGTYREETGQGLARYRTQPRNGRFRREMTLAPGVAYQDVHAEAGDGLLEVTVVEGAAVQQAQIPVGSTAEVPAPREPSAQPASSELLQES